MTANSMYQATTQSDPALSTSCNAGQSPDAVIRAVSNSGGSRFRSRMPVVLNTSFRGIGCLTVHR